MVRLNLKHDRYKEAASVSEKAGADIEAVLAKMQLRTKVKNRVFSGSLIGSPILGFREIPPGWGEHGDMK